MRGILLRAGGLVVPDNPEHETREQQLVRLLHDADRRERLLLQALRAVRGEAEGRYWLRDSGEDWQDTASYCRCDMPPREKWNEKAMRYEVGGFIDDVLAHCADGINAYQRLWLRGWPLAERCPTCGRSDRKW